MSALDRPHRLELRIAEGPFTGSIRYRIEPTPDGSQVTVRNVGTPGQFAWMPTFLIRAAMRSALTKDLRRLAAVVIG